MGKGGEKTGAGEALRKITPDEMKQHNKVSDAWCSMGSKVCAGCRPRARWPVANENSQSERLLRTMKLLNYARIYLGGVDLDGARVSRRWEF